MSIEIVPFRGWPKNLLISNDTVELLVTLEVGPRVLVFRRKDGINVLKNYADQMGGTNEEEWMIRGGHRLWISPEDEALTYALDNVPVEHRVNPDGSVTVITPAGAPWHIRKELTIKLDEVGCGVQLKHLAINEGGPTLDAATWALTVMAPGGVEILPQPPMGSHPEDLLPNRLLVVWPYTDLTDSRWKLGKRFITLRQTSEGRPTKLGLAHREKWVAYVLEKELFIKTFAWEPSTPYPDHGCNFETFSNGEMLEVESLGPLRTLSSGDSTSHDERWFLFGTDGKPPVKDEEKLAEWLSGYLRQAGL